MKKLAFAMVVGCALAATADFDLKVKLWRGESLSVIVPDECPDIGASAPGIIVEKGTLLPVRYLDGAKMSSLEYKTVADRPVYG